jgi:DeoR/GlpR family transcriptional regulator of sugar metabolism
MLPEHRRKQLMEGLSDSGAVTVHDLAENLGVSEATVRRDLAILERLGRVHRTHGGAMLPGFAPPSEPAHASKATQQVDEKQAIAREAAALVVDGDVVILDSGSTTLHLARELRTKRGLTVVTSDLKIALELCDAPTHDVIIVGGRVRPHLYSVIGPTAEGTLADIRVQTAFLGADAIDVEYGVTNANFDEVPVKQRALAAGAAAVLLADHTKFDKTSLTKVASVRAFDRIITDWRIPAATAHAIRQAGVDLTIASQEAHG